MKIANLKVLGDLIVKGGSSLIPTPVFVHSGGLPNSATLNTVVDIKGAGILRNVLALAWGQSSAPTTRIVITVDGQIICDKSSMNNTTNAFAVINRLAHNDQANAFVRYAGYSFNASSSDDQLATMPNTDLNLTFKKSLKIEVAISGSSFYSYTYPRYALVKYDKFI